MKKRKVLIKKCEDYNENRIQSIIQEGMQYFESRPKGKVLIKPNCVTANTEYIHHSFTHPKMIESMVHTLQENYQINNITIGESGGIGMPTRLFFHDSLYDKMAKNLKVPLKDFNEERTYKVELKKAKWHKTMLVASSLYQADYKIWMPKLKYHIVTQITNALKLNIGILTHKERFLYHDDRLNEKVVDMLEIGYPDLIITDAVIIGHGFESSPYPFSLGAVLISDDPLAIDMVAARILNYQPEEVLHLVEASQRGYGSLSFENIEVTGDISIEELSQKTREIVSLFQDLQALDTPIRFYEGTNKETGNICFGGCICSIKGCLGTAEKKYPGNLIKAKKGAIVMGYYQGDVIHPGEPVALIGSCAGVSGKLEAGKIIRIKGCPVKVKDLMLFLLYQFKMKSPAFDMMNMLKLIYFSIIKLAMQMMVPFRKKIKIPKT